jgi:phosphoribosylglycinamide formyltransferase-1
MQLNLGILSSHNGSNVQAIIDSVKNQQLNANICVIISNNPNSGTLEKAKKANIPAFCVNEKSCSSNVEKVDKELIRIFEKYNVNLVILAGYMKKISPELLKKFNNRILNIHPALLPKFGGKGMFGMNIHKAVIAAKEKFSGATIHLVNENYDEGRILAQEKVAILENDTPETLAKRVLEIEHRLYSNTLSKIANNEILI